MSIEEHYIRSAVDCMTSAAALIIDRRLVGNPDRCAELLVRSRDDIDRALRELAERREPLTLKDITPDNCNIPDREIELAVRKLRDSYDSIDVSVLDTTSTSACEKWELIAGWCDRYKVRVCTRYERHAPSASDIPAENYWVVLDTENDDQNASELGDCEAAYYDEAEANEACARLNREETTVNLNGFPFAQTYGYEIEEGEAEEFASCGFLVWKYDDDKVIAGIDGGGYSMDGAHWAPLLYLKRKGRTIETSTGPRRVE